jgi:excisionase family DNA binding protein
MAIDTDEREYLAPKEVAHELRVHVSAVYRAVERGVLPAVRLSESGAIRIPPISPRSAWNQVPNF